jgi:hypothetical protein
MKDGRSTDLTIRADRHSGCARPDTRVESVSGRGSGGFRRVEIDQRGPDAVRRGDVGF